MLVSESKYQYWATRVKWGDMEKFISQKWDEEYRISDFIFGDGMYYVLMEQGTGWKKQRYRWSKIFPEEQINMAWKEELWINCMFHDGSFWFVVFSEIGEITDQRWYKSVMFPKEIIQKAWDDGYTLTHVGRGEKLWISVFSKFKDGSRFNGWKTKFRLNKRELLKEYQKKGNVITSINFGDEKWIYIYEKKNKVTGQKYAITKHFPENEINTFWDEGFFISKLCYGDGKWFLLGTSYRSEVRQEAKEDEASLELRMLFEEAKYKKVVEYFEKQLNNSVHKENIHFYLQSLYRLNPGSEKLMQKAQSFNHLLKTDQWNIYIGHYYFNNRQYDLARDYYLEKYDEGIEQIDKKFKYYNHLFERKDYLKVTEYFETELYNSNMKKPRVFISYYLKALFELSRFEKGNEAFMQYSQKYPDDRSFYEIGGDIKYELFSKMNDKKILNEAIFCYNYVTPRSDKILRKIEKLRKHIDKEDSIQWKKEMARKEQELRNKDKENKYKHI